MTRRLVEPGELTTAQRRMIRKLESDPDYRPQRGRTKQTLQALLRKRAVKFARGKIVPLVRLK